PLGLRPPVPSPPNTHHPIPQDISIIPTHSQDISTSLHQEDNPSSTTNTPVRRSSRLTGPPKWTYDYVRRLSTS
ncbi:unnamed protein product, partial [Dovyalis caffra]